LLVLSSKTYKFSFWLIISFKNSFHRFSLLLHLFKKFKHILQRSFLKKFKLPNRQFLKDLSKNFFYYLVSVINLHLKMCCKKTWNYINNDIPKNATFNFIHCWLLLKDILHWANMWEELKHASPPKQKEFWKCGRNYD
jgi:hypothetical protein